MEKKVYRQLSQPQDSTKGTSLSTGPRCTRVKMVVTNPDSRTGVSKEDREASSSQREKERRLNTTPLYVNQAWQRTCHPGTWTVEAEVQNHPLLHGKLRAIPLIASGHLEKFLRHGHCCKGPGLLKT